jgi:hypothetical protein
MSDYSKEEFQAEMAVVLRTFKGRLHGEDSVATRWRQYDPDLADIIENSYRAIVSHLESREVKLPDPTLVRGAAGKVIGKIVSNVR